MTPFTRSSARVLGTLGLLLGLGLPAASVLADPIEAKIEQQGNMNRLRVTDLRAVNRNGLLNVQAEVTNLSPSNERLFYRFKWLDDSGFSVWDDEPWKPVLLHGKQKQLITVVAPTPQARDFRLVLQSPNNSADDTSPSSTTWPDKY